MIKQNKIENSDDSILTKHKKRYKLHVDEKIAERIQIFCEIFNIKLNKFVVDTVIYYLYVIEDDIESNENAIIGKFYDISKLVGGQPIDTTHKNFEKYDEINVEFPFSIFEVIEIICDDIPLTPEEFIEDTVTWTIKDIIENITKGRYHFLDKYKDFSKIAKSIQQLEINLKAI